MGDETNGTAWVWQFGLYPIDENRTRLISRSEVLVQKTLGTWLLMRAIEPAAFLMTLKKSASFCEMVGFSEHRRRSRISSE